MLKSDATTCGGLGLTNLPWVVRRTTARLGSRSKQNKRLEIRHVLDTYDKLFDIRQHPYKWPYKRGNWGYNPYKRSSNPIYYLLLVGSYKVLHCYSVQHAANDTCFRHADVKLNH